MPRATLTITVDERGTITVDGCIDNKAMAYSLLECARDAIKDHTDALAKSPILPAAPGVASHLSLERTRS